MSLVKFNVSGKLFTVSRSTVEVESGHPACNKDNLLAVMLSHDDSRAVTSRAIRDDSGAYFLDRDSECFPVLLNFFRTGRIFPPAGLNLNLLREEFDFFLALSAGNTFDQVLRANDLDEFGEKCHALLRKDEEAIDDMVHTVLRKCLNGLLVHLALSAIDESNITIHVDLVHQQPPPGQPTQSDAELQAMAPYGCGQHYVLYTRVEGIEHQLICAYRSKAVQFLHELVQPHGWRCKLTVGGTGWNRVRFNREAVASPE